MTAAATAKPLHVGLPWHTFRSENLGVGALTLANINLIAFFQKPVSRWGVFNLHPPNCRP